jgi:8-amino-7-oxononanoate synthase
VTHKYLDRIQNELSIREKDNTLRSLKVNKQYRLNLSNNDYLQLRTHPKVISSAIDTMKEYGTGTGASPLLSGYLDCHQKLIDQLTKWKQKTSGMLFNTGFIANQAILKCIPGVKDLVLVDRLAHHSILQVLEFGKVRFRRYSHIDMDHLEQMLELNKNRYETIFVVTESIFSMDGDFPDLKKLASLKSKYSFILILDEAHGTGIFGPTGGGLAEECDVLEHVDILVGTLGKALGGMGAYVLTSNQSIIDYLVNMSGEFIYSTYFPPAQVGAAIAAINITQGMNEERKIIRENAAWFRKALLGAGWETNDFDSQIIPLIVGKPKSAEDLAQFLMEKGILVSSVRPPTVPKDSSRIRFSINSGITRENLLEILDLLSQWQKT